MCLNASLAGLVGITAPCATVDALGAILIGAVDGILVVLVVELLDFKLHVDDPVGAVAVHLSLIHIFNVLPEGQGYPTTVELTVPGSMTVIPFGTSEAEVVETHGNGTATWRYEDDSAGGIVYAGDYIRQDVYKRQGVM